MSKGDIILITFPFTDLSGTKLRPAVILIETESDITVCFITTQLEWQETSDIVLNPSEANGLRKLSFSKIATLDKSLAKGLLGKLTTVEIADLNKSLKQLMQL